jgi:FlaG/FlaF family flagellin (archaellin)
MKKGLSPIIATMLLVGIAISIGTIVSIWLNAQSQEYMYKEGERRDRILDKEGESLTLVHVNFDSGTKDLALTIQSNGTSDLTLSYLKVNGLFYDQSSLSCSPSDCTLNFNESGSITVTLPVSYTKIEDIQSLEIGTVLGNLFIYQAPSPLIRIASSFIDTNNKLITFSGEGSVDTDGRIIKWEWCFDYDESTGTCNNNPITGNPAIGNGAVTSYSYLGYASGTYTVRLMVTDDTGMTGVILVDITIT